MALVNNKQRLVVVANSGMARFFVKRGEGEPLQAFFSIHSIANKRHDGHDKGSKPGHKQSDNRPGGVALSPRVDPQHKRHMAFAHQLGEQIDHALGQGTYDELAVFASSPFLGELRASLSDRAKRCLIAEIDLDLTSFGLSELESRLDEQLRTHHGHMV